MEVDVVPLAFQLLYQVRSSAKWDEFRFTERASSEFKALQGFEYEQIVGILQKFIDTLPGTVYLHLKAQLLRYFCR